MAEPTDIIQAIEDYLEKSGKGKNYLASKITDLMEGVKSPISLKGKYMINLAYALESATKKLQQFDLSEITASAKLFSYKLSNIIPKQGYETPTYTSKDVTSPIDETLHHLTNFMSEFRYEILGKFFDNLENANSIFMDMKTAMKATPNEDTLNNNGVMNVNVVSMASGLVSSIIAGFLTASAKNGKSNDSFIDKLVRKLDERPKEKEDTGIVGTIIKGIIGTTALFAGIGFITEFLNNTVIGRVIKEKLGNLKDATMPIIGSFINKFKDYAMAGIKIVWDTVVDAVKSQFSNFQFFGLKDLLGKDSEGLAVLLTKGIYYGVSNTFYSLLNKVSFGGLTKVTDFLYNKLGTFAETLNAWGTKLWAPFSKGLEKITGFFGKVTGIGDNIFKFFTEGSGIFGKIGSIFKGGSKLLGGGIFKILGKGLAQIAKRIPFIGALISFKDAYDRFQGGDYTGGLISIGSGIASIFPGIGTAISIGLDVLNAFLDSASDGGKKSKLGMIGDFLGDITEKMVSGIKTFFSGLIQGISDMVIDAGKFIADKTGISWISDKIQSGYNYVTGNAEPAAIQVNDASIMARQTVSPTVIQPSNKDQIIAMQSGGPFDNALKDMTTKLNMLIEVFTEGVQLIASANMQGSSQIVQAVVATGKSGGSTGSSSTGSSRDPIGEYRARAQRAIDYSSR